MEFPALATTGMEQLLSNFGREVFTPKGIFYWSARAKKEADVNATLGSAFGQLPWMEKPGVCYIPAMMEVLGELDPSEIFPYAPICGLPEFRQAWRKWILVKAGTHADAIKDNLSLPVVVPGITTAIHFMARLFLDPGEQIICAAKRWENYDHMFGCLGMSAHIHNTFAGDQFDIEAFIQAVQQTWQQSNRAVALLNFPNNPTGYVPDQATVTAMREAIVTAVEQSGKSIVLVFDDAYEGFVYEPGVLSHSPFYQFVDCHERVLPVKLDGSSKEMLWYGGRIGAMTFGLPSTWLEKAGLEQLNSELDSKVGGMIRGTLSNSPHIVQSVLARALAHPEAFLEQRQVTVDLLAERAAILKQSLAQCQLEQLSADPFQGGFFAFMNVIGKDAHEVAEHAITKGRVAMVPSVREADGINGVRVAFCGTEAADLPRLVEVLAVAVSA